MILIVLIEIIIIFISIYKNTKKKDQNITVILVWSNNMISIFLQLLEELNDIGKQSNIEFKPKSWNVFHNTVLKKYKGISYIKIDKLKIKHDYINRTL